MPERRLLVACAAAAIAACTPLGLWVYNDPGLEVSRVRVNHDTGADPVVVGLAVWNPNDYDVSTARFELELKLDDMSVGRFSGDSVVSVPTVGLADVALVGLGFGGWIAAEMATMSPRAFRRLVLVGAMGIKPAEGEILDQALVSYIDYVRAGFEDQSAFDRLFSPDPPTPLLEQWDLNREMTFRIAWKPYMYNPTLPPLLAGVRTPALIVHGRQDRIVPPGCAEQYARALPGSRVEIVESAGHFVDMEQPDTLAKLIVQFVAES